MDQDQMEAFDDALKLLYQLLQPKTDKEREWIRRDLGYLCNMPHRQRSFAKRFGKPEPAKARKDIDTLRKHLTKAADTLKDFDPLAHGTLFTPENIDQEFRGMNGLDLGRLLRKVVAHCPDAKQNVVNWRKRPKLDGDAIVRGCLDLIEEGRPNKAMPFSDDFQTLVQLVYVAATGEEEPELERSIRRVVEQRNKQRA